MNDENLKLKKEREDDFKEFLPLLKKNAELYIVDKVKLELTKNEIDQEYSRILKEVESLDPSQFLYSTEVSEKICELSEACFKIIEKNK